MSITVPRQLGDETPDDYFDNTHRACIGPVAPVMPLYRPPLAAVTDPGQVSDDTAVEIPVLKLPKAVA